MKLDPKKCKDFSISFLRNPPQELSSTLSINSQPLEKVTRFKLLGVTLQNDLKWNAHVDAITSKASKRLHILRVLRNSGVSSGSTSCSTNFISKYVLFSCACYLLSSIPRLPNRRDTLCEKVLDKITVPSSRLNRLLPPTRVESHGRELRHSSHFSLFKCRADRFKNSFFPAMCSRTMNKS
jgi:hypothetical protein